MIDVDTVTLAGAAECRSTFHTTSAHGLRSKTPSMKGS